MNQNLVLLGTILAIAAISAPMVINYTSDKTPLEIKRDYQMVTDKTEIGPREFLRVDVIIQSPDISPNEIRVIGPDGKKYASKISMTDYEHGWAFQSTNNWPSGDYEIQLWHNEQNALTKNFTLGK